MRDHAARGHLVRMTTPIAPTTPSRRPLIASSFALRALATGVALSTFTGMSAFAATHLLNGAAPLQPSAAATTLLTGGDDDDDARPAPTIAPARRTTIGSGITTTTTPARTRTRTS